MQFRFYLILYFVKTTAQSIATGAALVTRNRVFASNLCASRPKFSRIDGLDATGLDATGLDATVKLGSRSGAAYVRSFGVSPELFRLLRVLLGFSRHFYGNLAKPSP
jgi:hypothetical protein